MSFTVSVQGLARLRVELPEIAPSIERAVVLRMSQIAYDETLQGAGRHSKTGALFQSVYNRAAAGRPGVQTAREVGHDPQRAPQALWVNFGTKPHDIRPRNKKALRWAGGGRFFFSKLVRHPGYKGDAYILDAAADALAAFRQIVDQATKDAA